MSRLRGLCVGAGYFSRFHFDAWRRIPDVEIVAICDTESVAAERAAGEFGVPRIFSDVEEALDRSEIDFVDIITPPATHLTLVESASRRGLAVICQKPLAPDFTTARELVETVQRLNARFMVHENFRFQPWHREIKRLLQDGAIGKTLHSLTFRSRTGDGWGSDAYLGRQPYFREMPRLLIHETGVHFIDTFRFLAGEVEEVYALLRRLNPLIRGEDTGLVTFRFSDGGVGLWDANRYNEPNVDDPRYTFGDFLVEGDGGSIRLYSEGRLTIQRLGEPEGDHEYHHDRQGFAGDCVYRTQRHFVEQLLAREPFETNGEDYLKTLAVQEAIYRSAAENRPVQVKEITAGNRELRKPAIADRVIDLSLSIDDRLPGARVQTAKTIDDDGWNATTLSLYSHCGTHMDAPRHFVRDAPTIDEQDLSICRGPAWVLDLTPVKSRELLTVDRVSRWENRVRPGVRLLLRTDWSHRFGTPAYRDELPRISPELADWLVERKVALIGVEPPSVADVNNLPELTLVHQILFNGGVVIVEGLSGLDRLRSDQIEFIAFPLKVVGGDGTPVRAVAIEEHQQ